MPRLIGAANPNWKGGRVQKQCAVCSAPYDVKLAHLASKYCSLRCVGIAQTGVIRIRARMVSMSCEVCLAEYIVPTSHASRHHCCSRECSGKRRSALFSGSKNPNWNGGLSRLPYPWNFREISQRVIQRDGYICQNPDCAGTDERLTAHHINYQKQDCREENLITLCSACNSKANFGRDRWQTFYESLMSTMAPKGAMGRRPSTPTEPAEPPWAATSGSVGEGTAAAHSFAGVGG